jgi:hypothetical protein
LNSIVTQEGLIPFKVYLDNSILTGGVMIRYFVIIIVASFLLTSCFREPPAPTFDPAAPCDVILNPALLSVPFDEFVLEGPETEAWISNAFPTSTVTVKRSAGTAGRETYEQFNWSEGDYSYSLFLSQERRYISISHRANGGPTLEPSLGHILRCFGDPEYYSAEVGVPMGETLGEYFTLWYPNLGISFVNLILGPAWYNTSYTASSPMGIHTDIFPVGSIEEMLHNRFSADENAKQESALLKEWPENFTEIRVEK